MLKKSLFKKKKKLFAVFICLPRWGLVFLLLPSYWSCACFKRSSLYVPGLCGTLSQRAPGSDVAAIVRFVRTACTCRGSQTLAEKRELLFLNLLNTSDCLWSHCRLPCVSPPGGICAPSAFTAQICHAFLGDSGSALTSLLLRLGCSHRGFSLAGVAALACKFPASFWTFHAAFRAFYTKCQTPSGSLAGS